MHREEGAKQLLGADADIAAILRDSPLRRLVDLAAAREQQRRTRLCRHILVAECVNGSFNIRTRQGGCVSSA
eukprot:6910549-Prymnesium_polylepis.1